MPPAGSQVGSIAPRQSFGQGCGDVGAYVASALSPFGPRSSWDRAPLSWLFPSQGGLLPWVFLQMSPSEQEQDVSREVQVAQELLLECRKFGWLLGLGPAAVPRHHPRRRRDALQLCLSRLLALILSCWRPTCPSTTPCLVS